MAIFARSRRIVAQPADLYIAAGDLATFRQGARSLRRSAQTARRTLWVLPGNHETHDDTRAFCKRFGFVDFHRQVRTLESAKGMTQWAGLGYSNITPFHTPGEYSEEEIANALAAFDGIRAALPRGAFPAVRHKARRIRAGQTCRQPRVARMGRARPAGLSFLRPHPRNRRTDATASARRNASTSANMATHLSSRRSVGSSSQTISLVDGINHKLPAVARAFTLGAHARRAAEFQMDDASFARGHRIETKGLARFAHALRRNTRGKLQFLQPRGAIISAIEPHAIMQPRVEPQPAMRDVFKRKQQLGVPLEQQFLILAAKGNQYVRFVAARFSAADGDFVIERPDPSRATRDRESASARAIARSRSSRASPGGRSADVSGTVPRRPFALSLILFSYS